MIVRVPVQQVAAVLIYLLAMTGITLLALTASSALGERAMLLALPHMENGPPKRSLIDQRRLDAMFAVPPTSRESDHAGYRVGATIDARHYPCYSP